MFKIKHLLDNVETDDGQRLWVESYGLTKDLREWCKVDHILTHLAPPMQLNDWFEQHPDGYDFYRSEYHDVLGHSRYLPVLRSLAAAGQRQNFTLLHTGDMPSENAAVALYEYLSELQAHITPEE